MVGEPFDEVEYGVHGTSAPDFAWGVDARNEGLSSGFVAEMPAKHDSGLIDCSCVIVGSGHHERKNGINDRLGFGIRFAECSMIL